MRRATAIKALIPLLLGAFALSACANNERASRIAGGAGGAVVGGAVGSLFGGGTGRLIATGAGSVIGALVGSEIAGDMSRHATKEHQNTTEKALEQNKSGQASYWANPDANEAGQVTPTKTYQRDDGRYCREFQQKIRVGGEVQEGYGKACRQPDGSWQIVQQPS